MLKYLCKRFLDDCIWFINSGDFFSSVNCWFVFIGNFVLYEFYKIYK